MTLTFRSLIFLVSLLCTSTALAQAPFVNGVDLTTTQAPWTMRILGQDLDITNTQAKPDKRSAYFMMVSESTRLNASVFIEPVGACRTSEACRDHVLGLGNPSWGEYRDLSKGTIKDFSYFEFYRPEVKGKPVKMLDMYAEYVADGYWIDLHISKVLYTKEDHKLFEALINAITFIPKAKPLASPFDLQVKEGQKTASDWLRLWSTSKCKETYASLSSITKSENSEDSWVTFCSKVNATVGPVTSRDLIGAAYTSSLPGKTTSPVSIHIYQTGSEKVPSFIEIIGMVREESGKWVITNYLPQR